MSIRKTVIYFMYAFCFLRLCWKMRNETPCRMKERRFSREVDKLKAKLGV